jgi:hypothetical protein
MRVSGASPELGVGVHGGPDQSVLIGEHDDLHAVAQRELGEDAPDMGLDRRLGEDQALSDPRVGVTAGHLRS